MSDLDSLLAAVIADPADDTVRLAYADELQARGLAGDEDRATFIRATIEYLRLTRLHEQLKADIADSVRLREVAAAWGACKIRVELPAGVTWFWNDLTQRGFVEEVHCNADTWWAVGDEVRRLHPLLRRVILNSAPAVVNAGEGFLLRGDLELIPADVLLQVIPTSRLADLCLRCRWPGVRFDILDTWNLGRRVT